MSITMSWVSCISKIFSPNRAYYQEASYQHLDTEDQVRGLAAFEYGDFLQIFQIRLVKLFNGSDGTPIHCELFTTSVTGFEAYKALSYAWGDSNLTHPIVCNGRRLMITANLHSALVHLRRAGEHILPLWIDSICIWQVKSAEKTQQVRAMKQIYQKAAEVIIWLGPSHEGTETALEIIKEVAKRKRVGVLSRVSALFTGIDLEMSYQQQDFNPEFFQGLPPPDSEKWRYVGDLLQLPWFSRLWVMQEIVAARKSIMRIGLLTVDPLTMLAAFHDLATRLPYSGIFLAAEAMPGRLYGGYLFRFSAGPQIHIVWLSDALFHTRNFKCSDPRDRIFASLGCFPNEFNEIIDYEVDSRQLFLDVARGPYDGASETDPGLNPPYLALAYLFKNFNYIDHRYADPSLPSWCPQWKTAGNFVPLLMIYKTESKISSGEQQSVYFTDFKEVLVLLGKHIGKIRDVVEKSLAITWDHPPCSDISLPKFNEDWATYEDRCFDLAKRTMCTTHSEEEIADVYVKCLTFHDSSSSFTVKAARASLNAWRLHQYMSFAIGDEPMGPKDLTTRMGSQFTWKELLGTPGASGFEEAFLANHRQSLKHSRLIIDSFGHAAGREFFASDRGHIGWAPPGAKPADEIYMFHGCKLPFVIRRAARPSGYYRLIGACYVQGFVDGEGLELPVETTTIKLI